RHVRGLIGGRSGGVFRHRNPRTAHAARLFLRRRVAEGQFRHVHDRRVVDAAGVLVGAGDRIAEHPIHPQFLLGEHHLGRGRLRVRGQFRPLERTQQPALVFRVPGDERLRAAFAVATTLTAGPGPGAGVTVVAHRLVRAHPCRQLANDFGNRVLVALQ
ncbi:MAG: hypothetical protein ACK55I_15125, partial [bacterium]